MMRARDGLGFFAQGLCGLLAQTDPANLSASVTAAENIRFLRIALRWILH
jgi:hypothetical protein